MDIVGHVTVAGSVIKNGMSMLLPPKQGFWIVQVSIKNKSYPTPITAKFYWSFGLISDPSNFGGVANLSYAEPSPASIASGETGQIFLCCVAPNGLDPNQFQICLSEVNGQGKPVPISYGKLVNSNNIAGIYNWDLQKLVEQVSSNSTPQSKVSIPSGTYTTTQMGVRITVTFKGNDTLEANNPLSGKTVYKYSISSDGQSITETNIATNQTGTESFEYIPAQGLVVLGGVSYFK